MQGAYGRRLLKLDVWRSTYFKADYPVQVYVFGKKVTGSCLHILDGVFDTVSIRITRYDRGIVSSLQMSRLCACIESFETHFHSNHMPPPLSLMI